MNAHCERITGSIRHEALDHVLITGQAHAQQVLAAYQRHYITSIVPIGPGTSYRPMPISNPPPRTTWKAADSYAPASSAVSSTSTDTWPDVQRQVFEPHRIQTCRRELLDRTLIWNQRHLLHALRQFESHYNQHRPHQGIANDRPLRPLPPPIIDPGQIADLDIRRRQRLGGILNEYKHAA